MVVKVVVEESAAGYRCSLLFFLVVGTIFCESEADLLMQIVNDAQLSGIRTCWLNSDDLDSYTRYFQMMLDQHYGSQGSRRGICGWISVFLYLLFAVFVKKLILSCYFKS